MHHMPCHGLCSLFGYSVEAGRFWNRTGTVEPNRRKSNSLRTVGTVNRWNPMQNRTGGTGTVLPSSGPSPNKLTGKNVIAF